MKPLASAYAYSLTFCLSPDCFTDVISSKGMSVGSNMLLSDANAFNNYFGLKVILSRQVLA